MGGTEHLTVRREGATLVLTLNRPEARNALSIAMLVGLYDGWLEADEDDSIRSIVFTGAGGAFCAGMDLKALAGQGMAGEQYRDRLKADPDLHWKAMLRHHRPRKPVIAAVEGTCVAGGTEMLQGTDIRVAGESATFGLFEVRRGLFPIGGSTVRLQRQIPRTHALEMLLTGRPTPPGRPLTSAWSGMSFPTARPWRRRWRSPNGSTPAARWRSRPSRRRSTRPPSSPRPRASPPNSPGAGRCSTPPTRRKARGPSRRSGRRSTGVRDAPPGERSAGAVRPAAGPSWLVAPTPRSRRWHSPAPLLGLSS